MLPIVFIASFLLWFMYLSVFLLPIFNVKMKKRSLVYILFTSILTWVVCLILKDLFSIPRPFLINGRETFTISVHNDFAFPSAHSALAFSLAGSIFLHSRKIGIIYLLLAILVGVGRVLANVHYPADVIGGGFIGLFMSFLIYLAFQKK